MLHKPEKQDMKHWILHGFRTKDPEALGSWKQKLSQAHCGTSFDSSNIANVQVFSNQNE